VDAGFVVHVGYRADELGEDPLYLGRLDGALLEEVVVELIAYCVSDVPKVFRVYIARTWTVLEHQPDEVLRDYDLVQPRDVRVEELAMVVDLAGEVGIVLLRRLKHNLQVFCQSNVSLAYVVPWYAPWSHW
jgi:hypothetical protein